MKFETRARRGFFLLALSCLLAACGTVTIKNHGISMLESAPTYSDTKTYYLWGLIGEYHIDGKAICSGEVPVQMQAQYTPMDALLSIITLGIYTPRTVKVWCSEGGHAG